MNTTSTKQAHEADELTPRALDWSKAVRGKYYDRFNEDTNLIVLAPDPVDTLSNARLSAFDTAS